MRYLEVQGPCQLNGTITVQGSKNSALALLPAAILTDDTVILNNVPNIRDVDVIRSIFCDLGVHSTFQDNTITIDPKNIHNARISHEKAGKYRASYYFMGALLARYKRVSIGFPGGDNFGSRPIDQHLKGFKALGVAITESKEGFLLEAESLQGAHIYFDVITCGGTINLILAAVLAKGETVLHNAARDPEVVDLCNMLNKMGAKIKGAGTDTIKIRGVDKLHGCTYNVIPDRLVAGTFIIAGLATEGRVRVEGVILEHIRPLLRKLEEMNANFTVGDDYVEVFGKQNLRATRVKTAMYPGFATDLQQPLTALMLKAKGRSIVTETIYPNRFSHVSQLIRLGAVIDRKKDSAFIQGGTPLYGNDVTATDVRAGITLLIAGLMAEGKTRIFEIEHIERGYADIIGDFAALGANITYGTLRENIRPKADYA